MERFDRKSFPSLNILDRLVKNSRFLAKIQKAFRYGKNYIVKRPHLI
jgi:hypothetical protein